MQKLKELQLVFSLLPCWCLRRRYFPKGNRSSRTYDLNSLLQHKVMEPSQWLMEHAVKNVFGEWLVA
jgi:hypothetical protein